MTTHVFVGAGPVNLHRALKVRKLDPEAKIVIIDKRLDVENRCFNRAASRANIFRFEYEDVTAKLIEDGVDKEALLKLMHQRSFSVEQGFQQGDDTVFAAKQFSQIQIRDIQQILLNTLCNQGNTYLISENLNLTSTLADQVIFILEEQGLKDDDIQIHLAVGTLKGDSEKHEIIYPDKRTYSLEDTTSDVAAMPVVPFHGTTTFFIKDEFGVDILTCDQLEKAQRSLDLTAWQKPLEKYGWNLIRPPRIRVFYANDVLYIGAEIPFSMMNMSDKREFEKQIAEYTREIASLVFPTLPIHELPTNTVLRSRFPTGRGECGNVISTNLSPIDDKKIKVTLFNNGDSRYLPHYQTGSGFVTGFLQNELYAKIYGHKHFTDLFTWAKKEGYLAQDINFGQLLVHFKRLTEKEGEALPPKEYSQMLLRAFQHELYVVASRQVIAENKEKVGRYFNALHRQTLTLLPNQYEEVFSQFKKYSAIPPILPANIKTDTDKLIAILAMLKSDNINFLRTVLPRLLNIDINDLKEEKSVIHLRDVHLEDLERNLTAEEAKAFNIFKQSKKFTALLKQDQFKFEEILFFYNQEHNTNYETYQFPKETRLLILMEMLNRNNPNIKFLRNVLPMLVDEDISQYEDKAILNLRNQITENYIDYIDSDFIKEAAKVIYSNFDFTRLLPSKDSLLKLRGLNPEQQYMRIIAAFAQKPNTELVRLVMHQCGLPFIAKEKDQQELGLRLANELLNQQDEQLMPSNSFSSIETDINRLILADRNTLINRLKLVKSNFEDHKELHQRKHKGMSFFKGKHSHTINEFIQALDDLIKQDLSKEDLQLETLTLLLIFHDNLKANYSIRAIATLRGAIVNSIETRDQEIAFQHQSSASI
ncbi:hypothetical protein ACNVED_05000 [Legionella sp. D16C41]|uniref:hypothetical protein n=1 Tax=Legionella sp. D16C41 TaxID=3402688 RepID=UPI003AF714B8